MLGEGWVNMWRWKWYSSDVIQSCAVAAPRRVVLVVRQYVMNYDLSPPSFSLASCISSAIAAFMYRFSFLSAV